MLTTSTFGAGKAINFLCKSAELLNKRGLKNEILKYKPGSPEFKALDEAIAFVSSQKSMEASVPVIAGAERIFSGDEQGQEMPHNHRRTLVKFHYSNANQIDAAINAAIQTKIKWSTTSPKERAEIWYKCADIIAKEDRHMINAAIIVGQGKPLKQAEEDTYRLIRSLRESADNFLKLSSFQLKHKDCHYLLRPLPGFVAAIAPFNETNLSAQLAFGPALMGNCVLWKPSHSSVLSNYMIWMAIAKAGLPPGVVNFIPSNSNLFVNEISRSPLLGGVNFAGRTANFIDIFNGVALHMKFYKSIPRLVGECGTNNFHFVHECANIEAVAETTVQAAFEYSGQKSTACSRIYVPETMWCPLNDALLDRIACIKIGDPCDFTSFMSAVINNSSYERIVKYIEFTCGKSNAKVFYGGDACKTVGYFIEPTIIICEDPFDKLMLDDINGPVLSVFIYKNDEMDKVLDLIAKSSQYAFTGSIFSKSADAVQHIIQKLRFSASNLYINESCTGSLNGHNTFSGTGLSGTNDNKSPTHSLMCWASPQLIEKSAKVE